MVSAFLSALFSAVAENVLNAEHMAPSNRGALRARGRPGVRTAGRADAERGGGGRLINKEMSVHVRTLFAAFVSMVRSRTSKKLTGDD
jgi:hypothetical protein